MNPCYRVVFLFERFQTPSKRRCNFQFVVTQLIAVIRSAIFKRCLHLFYGLDDSIRLLGELTLLTIAGQQPYRCDVAFTYAVTNRSWLCRVSERAVKSYTINQISGSNVSRVKSPTSVSLDSLSCCGTPISSNSPCNCPMIVVTCVER